MKVYINGQEEQHKYDQHDYMFCGEKTLYFGSLSLFFQQSLFFVVPGQASPQTINSPGPRLVLLFKAGMKSASGFKAQYRFETGGSHTVILSYIMMRLYHEMHIIYYLLHSYSYGGLVLTSQTKSPSCCRQTTIELSL